MSNQFVALDRADAFLLIIHVNILMQVATCRKDCRMCARLLGPYFDTLRWSEGFLTKEVALLNEGALPRTLARLAPRDGAFL